MPDAQDTQIHLSCQHFRCDFGLWVEEGNRMILIELKGSDVDTAYRQLQSTLGFFHSKFRREGFLHSLRIVPTRVTTPNLQAMGKKERKKGVDLLVHSVCFEERIYPQLFRFVCKAQCQSL